MALRNRQEIESTKLKGVILSAEPTDLELGRFTVLQNWIPAKLNSLKKKRGVQAFTSTVIVPTAPTPCADFPAADEGGNTPP